MWNMGQLAGLGSSLLIGGASPHALKFSMSGTEWIVTAHAVSGTAVSAWGTGTHIRQGRLEWTDTFTLLPLVSYAASSQGAKQFLGAAKDVTGRLRYWGGMKVSTALRDYEDLSEVGAILPRSKIKHISASSPNASDALKRGLSAVEDAQQEAVRTRTLPDGRIRYYEKEVLAKKPGSTRGRSHVTEYVPRTGRVRDWEENYDHLGRGKSSEELICRHATAEKLTQIRFQKKTQGCTASICNRSFISSRKVP